MIVSCLCVWSLSSLFVPVQSCGSQSKTQSRCLKQPFARKQTLSLPHDQTKTLPHTQHRLTINTILFSLLRVIVSHSKAFVILFSLSKHSSHLSAWLRLQSCGWTIGKNGRGRSWRWKGMSEVITDHFFMIPNKMAAPASAATPIAATVPPAIANPSRPSFQETKER